MLTHQFPYRVREGDTLFSVATRFNVPIETLMRLNGLENETILEGQTLLVPVDDTFWQIVQLVREQDDALPGGVQERETEEKDRTVYKRHHIRRGDTVYALAREHNTTPANILALNPQISDVKNIPVGLMITIPVPPQEAFLYTVRPGDTVFSVARAHNITPDRIMRYNYLESSASLLPGQKLVIVK